MMATICAPKRSRGLGTCYIPENNLNTVFDHNPGHGKLQNQPLIVAKYVALRCFIGNAGEIAQLLANQLFLVVSATELKAFDLSA
ncbi:MAG: hypothetical protein MI746_10830 [Pseudomonadales bacterium]|nr:hypothetical protein [Pseudomonadales bacterium]